MKHFILPIALGLALVSCNRDNDNATAETPILPIKIVDGDGVTEFKYNGDRLTEIISEGGVSKVQYTGDLITSITEVGTGDKTTYTYENNKLVKVVEEWTDNQGQKVTDTNTYQYNNDGTITRVDNNQRTTTITITNGNFVKEEVSDGYTFTYKYDTKNNPFKNVKGYSAILPHIEVEGNANNHIEYVEQTPYGTHTTTYTYDYNANNFPTKRTMTNSNAGKEETTYTYNK